MSELRTKNKSERDLCSCEVTLAVTNKAQKQLEPQNIFWALFVALFVTA